VIGPDNIANGMAISGAGFSNTVFYLSTTAGYYDTSLHQTFLSLVEDSNSVNITIHFHFNGEANFNAQDTLPGPYNVSDTITIYNQLSKKTIVYWPLYTNDILNITTYDNVGGHIDGAFSGTYLNNTDVLDTLKVSNGRFSIIRLPDVY